MLRITKAMLETMTNDVWRYNYIPQAKLAILMQDPVYKEALKAVHGSSTWQRELGLHREQKVGYEDSNGNYQQYEIPDIRVTVKQWNNEKCLTIMVYRHEELHINYPRSYVRGTVNRGNRTGGKEVLQCHSSQSYKCQTKQYKGLGRELYRELIEQARQFGKEYQSDNTLSPYGLKAYLKLLMDGYDVKINPYNRNGGIEDLYYDGSRRPHRDGDGNGTPYDKGGVVTVIPSGKFQKRVSILNFKYQDAIVKQLLTMAKAHKAAKDNDAAKIYTEVANQLLTILDEQEAENFRNKNTDYLATNGVYKQVREEEAKAAKKRKKKVPKDN